MIRYFLAKGDRAGSAVIIEGLESVTCSNPPPPVNIATLYMKTWCAACKREGFVAPRGPRKPGTAPDGRQWALSGDVNVCGCNPPPVFYAERGMSMKIAAEEVAALMDSLAGTGITGASDAAAADDLVCYYEIVDAFTGEPVEGMTYKLSNNGRTLFNDARLEGGRTRQIPARDHRDLTFVAWHTGDVR